jgi:hypothetical protein
VGLQLELGVTLAGRKIPDVTVALVPATKITTCEEVCRKCGQVRCHEATLARATPLHM